MSISFCVRRTGTALAHFANQAAHTFSRASSSRVGRTTQLLPADFVQRFDGFVAHDDLAKVKMITYAALRLAGASKTEATAFSHEATDLNLTVKKMHIALDRVQVPESDEESTTPTQRFWQQETRIQIPIGGELEEDHRQIVEMGGKHLSQTEHILGIGSWAGRELFYLLRQLGAQKEDVKGLEVLSVDGNVRALRMCLAMAKVLNIHPQHFSVYGANILKQKLWVDQLQREEKTMIVASRLLPVLGEKEAKNLFRYLRNSMEPQRDRLILSASVCGTGTPPPNLEILKDMEEKGECFVENLAKEEGAVYFHDPQGPLKGAVIQRLDDVNAIAGRFNREGLAIIDQSSVIQSENDGFQRVVYVLERTE